MANELTQKQIDTSETEVFEYLADLRESGVTNMFGASPYLEQVFDFDKSTARAWLSRWMKSFTG